MTKVYAVPYETENFRIISAEEVGPRLIVQIEKIPEGREIWLYKTLSHFSLLRYLAAGYKPELDKSPGILRLEATEENYLKLLNGVIH